MVSLKLGGIVQNAMALFTRSPALSGSQTSSIIDPHQPAEYPVLLGDAFKDGRHKFPASLSARFNWKAQKSSSIARMHLETSKSTSESTYNLTIEDHLHKDKPYKYAGHVPDSSTTGRSAEGKDGPEQSLALVWDPARSAFLLEPISASLEFNLVSAPGQSQREIEARKKLPTSRSKDSEAEVKRPTGPTKLSSESDSDPDESNPYDFRHFLAEAREKAANEDSHARSKTPIPGSRTPVPGSRTPIPGSRTPIPGGRTPLLGVPSPAPAANKSTPQFHATSGQSTKKRKVDRSSHAAKVQSTARKQPSSDPKRDQPLSPELIMNSDEEADPSVVEPLSVSNHRKQLSALNSPPASNNNRPSSPHLIVSDADAELEIDLGSPPPPSRYTQRKRPNVNPDAFHHRPQVNTPRIEEDVEMTDADVEELELGSPRSRAMSVSTHAGRIERSDEVEDDDDGLAAELEAALEEEEETEGIGLGITSGGGDESEISEEE